ncbi:MAG: lysostaphin resistance A-like protein [Propioniciclava sp.]
MTPDPVPWPDSPPPTRPPLDSGEQSSVQPVTPGGSAGAVTEAQIDAVLPPEALPKLPIVDTDYVRFFRGPRFRWWKSLLALVAVGFAWVIVGSVLILVGYALDGIDLVQMAVSATISIGPWSFLANNVALALCIPLTWLAAWAILGQRPRWLASVVGGIRWAWLWRVGAIVLPIWVVLSVIAFIMEPDMDMRWRSHSLLMIVGILLTTPLQAAGEEYLIRGFLVRCVGSWIRPELAAFTVSTLVGSAVFMSLHGAGDPWLNAFYFVFGAVGSWLTWRTGGLEAAIALHVINNLLGEIFMPFVDFSEMFDRGVGAGDPSLLLNMGFLVATGVLLDFYSRRQGLVVRSAPGLEALAAARSHYRTWLTHQGGVAPAAESNVPAGQRPDSGSVVDPGPQPPASGSTPPPTGPAGPGY